MPVSAASCSLILHAARASGGLSAPRVCPALRSVAGRRCVTVLQWPAHPSPGFTLVELLVVLVVIAVAAGMIIPRMGASLTTRELREASGRFAHTARTVRELAVARTEAFSIEIDLEHGYAVSMPSSRDPRESQIVQASWIRGGRWPSCVKQAVVRTMDGQTLTRGTHRLWFHPDGSTSGASLRLQGVEAGEFCVVVVFPHTGRVVQAEADNAARTAEDMDLGD